MKEISSSVIISAILLLSSVGIVNAYTVGDVATHSSSSSCWVIYDGGVYDITKYLTTHDENLNIRSWCGTDITKEFQTKDGQGEDHKQSSYTLLEQYRIGKISKVVEPVVAEEPITTASLEPVVEDVQQDVVTSTPKEYNLLIPLLLSSVLYWGTYILVKRNKFFRMNIVKFNGFWNSILLLTLLIPSFGFGIFMIARIKNPSLMNIDFDFRYWHVELSIVMGVLGLSHLIQRLGIYLRQLSLKK